MAPIEIAQNVQRTQPAMSSIMANMAQLTRRKMAATVATVKMPRKRTMLRMRRTLARRIRAISGGMLLNVFMALDQ